MAGLAGFAWAWPGLVSPGLVWLALTQPWPGLRISRSRNKKRKGVGLAGLAGLG